MQTITVIEDEKSISEMIRLNLEMDGFVVELFDDGRDAMEHISQIILSDLVVLDVMLPHFSGLDICKKIREISKVPILFLSAKGTTPDKIAGLKLGANDYLSKPFDLEELLLRVHILTQKEVMNETYQIGHKIIHFSTFEVVNCEMNEVHLLSKKEIELLKLFIEKVGLVISRDEILDKIWGKDQFPTSRTIDNFILNFRKMFEEDPKNPLFFHSIRGVGYKLTI
ncbi:MAG: response regulator transcription factor [Flavobacteriia bacterium]|nr:response regulator transcription factor [Flavobacteriia bacterium]